MVALSIMALLALLSWRGLDAMVRAQQVTQERGERLTLLQTALAQWRRLRPGTSGKTTRRGA